MAIASGPLIAAAHRTASPWPWAAVAAIACVTVSSCPSLFVPCVSALCGCTGCSLRSVSAGSTVTVSMVSPCSSGYAVVSTVQVKTDDGSGFNVRTYNPPDAVNGYTAASTSGATCFNSPFATNVGGAGYSTIAVDIRCNNLFQSCPIQYNVDFACLGGVVDPCAGVSCGLHGACNGGTCSCTDGYTGSSCSIAPGGTQPVQPAGTSVSCTCCAGNSCTPTLQGYVSVTDSCGGSSSTYSGLCRTNFPTACTTGSGSVMASCSSSSGPAVYNPSGWLGNYSPSGCDRNACCCFTGVSITATGSTMYTVSGPVSGVCGTTTYAQSTVNTPTSNVFSYTANSQSHTATRNPNSQSISDVNQADSRCNGFLTKTSAAATNSAGAFLVACVIALGMWNKL